ncbi:hypothetical protein ACWGE1_02255 [Streptomyces sp. NPDC054932]
MTLLEMGGADDQGCLAGRPEDAGPRGTGVAVFDAVAAFLGVVAEAFDVVAIVFGVVAEAFASGAAERVAVRGADDGDAGDARPGDSDGTGVGDGAAGREGCTGMPIAGASACTPIRLLPMATARTAPTTETGQPKPRSRRPRRPDWSTNTGAGSDSRIFDSDMSGSARRAGQRSMELMIARTLRRLSAQGR